MEVSEGYKQTDVGTIPNEWEVRTLGDIVQGVEYGSSLKSKTNGSIPVLRMGNIQNGKIDFSDLVFTDDDDEIRKYALKKDDVLFNRTNTIDLVGKTGIYKSEYPAIFAGYLIRVKRKEHLLNADYLNYWLNTSTAKNYGRTVLSIAVGQANINGAKLKTYPIPLPPTLQEQTAIATALSDADALISSLEKLITKKRNIKQGAMQELLKPQKGWVVKKVKEFGTVITGSTPSTQIKEYWNGSIPWVTPTDISSERDIFRSEREISRLGFDAIRALPANTLLITCIASIGKNAILRHEGSCNQQINALVPYDDFNVDFLYYLFENNKKYLLGKAGITATLLISKRDFSEIQFSVPSKHEQINIADTLLSMDYELSALQSKMGKYKQIKSGMMQNLLTGKIRLIWTASA